MTTPTPFYTTRAAIQRHLDAIHTLLERAGVEAGEAQRMRLAASTMMALALRAVEPVSQLTEMQDTQDGVLHKGG